MSGVGFDPRPAISVGQVPQVGAITAAEFNLWLLNAVCGDRIAWLDGKYKPRTFAVSKAVRDADAAGLVACFFNQRHAPPAYMAERTSKPLPPGFAAAVAAPRCGGGPAAAPAHAEAVLAALEMRIGAAGLLPTNAEIAAAIAAPIARVVAALHWLRVQGVIIIKRIVIGSQCRRYCQFV